MGKQLFLISLYVNLYNNFFLCRIAQYSTGKGCLALVLMLHNIFIANYAFILAKRYVPLCLANMLCVEQLQIQALFDKADQLELHDQNHKFYCYTRKSIFRNICEMMGTYNIPSWFSLLPEYYWQSNITKYLKERVLTPKDQLAAEHAFGYMIKDKEACAELLALQEQVTKRESRYVAKHPSLDNAAKLRAKQYPFMDKTSYAATTLSTFSGLSQVHYLRPKHH